MSVEFVEDMWRRSRPRIQTSPAKKFVVAQGTDFPSVDGSDVSQPLSTPSLPTSEQPKEVENEKQKRFSSETEKCDARLQTIRVPKLRK